MWKGLKYAAVLACSALVVCDLAATGEDKGKPALSGAWVRQEGELKIEFSDKDVMKVFPHGSKDLIVVCEYALEKGRIKAKVTDFEGKEKAKEHAKEKLPAGTEFSFQWKIKDGVATIADVKGDKAERLSSHLEGKYERKKK